MAAGKTGDKGGRAASKPFAAGEAGTTGGWPADAPKPTINDIARLARVSKKTVSRVINESPFVRKETRERIAELMRQSGYVPDPQARGLAFRRSFLIGMIYDNPNAAYIVNLQNGALDSLRGSGFELVVHPCDRRAGDFIDGVRRFVQQQKLYGVILLPPVSENQELADALREINVRYVRIASVALDEAARMIVSHEREGAAEAANYLESLGHQHIGFIAGPSSYRSAHERKQGFIGALKKRGLTLAPEAVVEGGYTFESGVACAEKLLALTPRPTAIFASNDEMAAGVYRVAHRLGLAVPEDVSIVGFDDSPLATRLWPSMTTVHSPIIDMGRRAAAALLGPEPEDGQTAAPSAVTPHLVIRDSAGPPKA